LFVFLLAFSPHIFQHVADGDAIVMNVLFMFYFSFANHISTVLFDSACGWLGVTQQRQGDTICMRKFIALNANRIMLGRIKKRKLIRWRWQLCKIMSS